MMEHSFPAVLGKDFAGTVEELGEGVRGLALGDPVFGVMMKPSIGEGSFGQYVTVPAGLGITRNPVGLELPQAGALGLAGAAALQAVDALRLVPGEVVLVVGATAGVGALAVQLATAAGAVVIATGRPGPDELFLRELGATHVVDYGQDLAEGVWALSPSGVDGVLHLAGDGGSLAELIRPGSRSRRPTRWRSCPAPSVTSPWAPEASWRSPSPEPGRATLRDDQPTMRQDARCQS